MEETREQIFELSEQLQAALIAYDEGLQSSDIVLAGALWRRIYQQGPVNVTDLEALVKYIRKQVLNIKMTYYNYKTKLDLSHSIFICVSDHIVRQFFKRSDVCKKTN